MNWVEYILTPQLDKFKCIDRRQKKRVAADLHDDIKKKNTWDLEIASRLTPLLCKR